MTIASLRLALRIARRDARRTVGRSIMVIILLGLPVFIVTAGASTIDSFSPSEEQQADRKLGNAEANIAWEYDSPVIPPQAGMAPTDSVPEESGAEQKPHTKQEILSELPAGSRLTETTSSNTTARTSKGVKKLDVVGIDMSDSMTDGIFTQIDGSKPTGDHEVALSTAAAEDLNRGVGDTMKLDGIAEKVTIAAIVESSDELDRWFVAGPPKLVGGDHDGWLADTKSPLTAEDIDEYSEIGMSVYARASSDVVGSQPTTDASGGGEEVALVGFMIGMIGLEIILLAGPAFTISAKRRSREFALLAANGATPGQIRRTVLAGGVVLGAFAALVGLALGAAAAFAATPAVEQIVEARTYGFSMWPVLTIPAALVAVLTGLLAALVPAFTVARQPVVTALTGRRGQTRSRKRWVFLGLALIAVGCGCALFGVNGTQTPLLLAGIGLFELGLVLCTPALVGLVSKLARFLPLAPRIALRDAGRNRSAAAPAISAIMAVVAGGIAITMFTVGDQERFDRDFEAGTPTGSVSTNISWSSGSDSPDVSATERNAAESRTIDMLKKHFPVEDTYELKRLDCGSGDAEQWCQPIVQPPQDAPCPYEDKDGMVKELSQAEQAAAVKNPRCKATNIHAQGIFSSGAYMVDDETLKALSAADEDELSAATKVFHKGGVIVSDSDLIRDGKINIEVQTQSYTNPDDNHESAVKELPAYALSSSTLSRDEVLYSKDAAAELGMAASSTDVNVLATTSRTPTQDEQDGFDQELLNANMSTESMSSSGSSAVNWEVAEPPKTPAPMAMVLNLLIAGSGLLALGATAVATALAAAESRRDMASLAAIGASPTIRRKLSLFQAGLISSIGAVLGVVAGIGACYVAMVSLNSELATAYPRESLFSLVPPWENILVAILVVPLIAMLGAGLLTRSRLPSERSMQ